MKRLTMPDTPAPLATGTLQPDTMKPNQLRELLAGITMRTQPR